MGWWSTGFDSAKNAYDYDDSQKGTRRFWVPAEQTRRIMFLDNDPVTYWEHHFKHNGSWNNFEPCKIRNKMDSVCAICARYPETNPSFVGLLTIINMTPWESKKGREGCYNRELFVAKLGSKEKPGILKRIERKKKEHGRLRGVIFDVYRSGAKAESVGDEYTMIEAVDVDDIVKYGKAKIAEWAERVNAGKDPKDKVTIDKMWEYNPWVPFDYDKDILKVRSNDELRIFLGSGSSAAEGQDNESDDDIPY